MLPAELANPFERQLPSLADVMSRPGSADLPEVRKRDLISAVRRAGVLTGKPLHEVPVDLRELSRSWRELSPVALGISSKTLRTIKSNLLAAIEASEFGKCSGQTVCR